MEKENCFIVREDGTVQLNGEAVPNVLSFSVAADGVERSVVTVTFLADQVSITHGIEVKP